MNNLDFLRHNRCIENCAKTSVRCVYSLSLSLSRKLREES